MAKDEELSGLLPALEPDEELDGPSSGPGPIPPPPPSPALGGPPLAGPPGSGGVLGPPPFGGPPPSGAAGQPGMFGPPSHAGRPPPADPASESVARLGESLTGMDAISLVDLDGGGEGPAPDGGIPPGPAAAPKAGPDVENRTVDLAPGLEEDAPLELDLDKAGLQGKTTGQPAPGQVAPGLGAPDAAAVASDAPASSPPEPVAEPAPQAPSHTAAAGVPGQASPAPRPDRVRLLGEDTITAALLAVAIGLGAGLLVANESARRAERDRLEPLRMELVQVVERPLAARAGEIRTSRAVKNDLAAAHEDTRKNFFVMWLLTALPIGGGLFLIKRSA